MSLTKELKASLENDKTPLLWLISCTAKKNKSDDLITAKDRYWASDGFKESYYFVEKHRRPFDTVMIVSANFGLIKLDTLIPNYNMTLFSDNKLAYAKFLEKHGSKKLWGLEVTTAINKLGFTSYVSLISRTYQKPIKITPIEPVDGYNKVHRNKYRLLHKN